MAYPPSPLSCYFRIHPVPISVSCCASSSKEANTAHEEHDYDGADNDAQQCHIHLGGGGGGYRSDGVSSVVSAIYRRKMLPRDYSLRTPPSAIAQPTNHNLLLVRFGI